MATYKTRKVSHLP